MIPEWAELVIYLFLLQDWAQEMRALYSFILKNVYKLLFKLMPSSSIDIMSKPKFNLEIKVTRKNGKIETYNYNG